MAMKTKFTQAELEYVLADYDLGTLQSYAPFEKGSDQTNILLSTDKSKVVFRYYEKRSEEYVKFEIEALHYLVEHQYPCPGLIKSKSGKYIGLYKEKPFALFDFMEGNHSEDSHAYKKVARVIAKLHRLTFDYEPSHLQAREAYDVASAWKSAQENAKKLQAPSEANQRLDWMRARLDEIELPQTMPKAICHGDTNPTNFLYLNKDVSAVLDFDQSSYTYALYDIANMIYWWTWPNEGELNFVKTKELLKAYEDIRPLSDIEKHHLFDMIKMVILVGIGWFIHEDDFSNSKRKVDLVNTIGRKEFYKKLFAK